MNFSELLTGCLVSEWSGSDVSISGICYDSRKVRAGDVFVCITGFSTNGHDYILNAIQGGAVAVIMQQRIDNVHVPYAVVRDSRKVLAQVSSRFYGNPSAGMKVIGVTGTNGKTTTTYLLKSILEHAGKKVGLIGTNETLIESTAIESKHTTPESLELQQLFCQMRDAEVEYVVMEVSSHSLSLSRVVGCAFEVGVFTNLTQDHLDFHASMQDYALAKAKLFSMCKHGVINADDQNAPTMTDGATCDIITYGIKNSADVLAKNITLDADGVSFSCDTASESFDVRLGIPGNFSVYNALAAISAAHIVGIGNDIIKKALAATSGVRGRAEVVPTKRDFSIIIDYAHTPDSLKNILETLRAFSIGRVVTLFGCGGGRDRSKRAIMGEIAAQLSDFCIVTSDNPRNEVPGDIIKDILSGMPEDSSNRAVIENRRDAIEHAIKTAQPGDTILLAGKGHETYQIIGDKTIGFDERRIVADILTNS